MLWLIFIDAFASGQLAVPPQLEQPPPVTRYRTRPSLLNHGSEPWRRWTLDELYSNGRFPVTECDRVFRAVPTFYLKTCEATWLAPPKEVQPPAPWWAFWR